MMIRKFEFAEYEEYGFNGWKPMWMQGADPITGQGIPHDILEHHPGMQLGAEAEFHALGASWWIRGENGYFTGRYRPPEENYASDFIEILRRISDGEETLHHPGPTRPIRESMWGHVDRSLNKIVSRGIEMANSEFEDYPLVLPHDAHERILGWMRKGYRYAIRRYNHVTDGYSLCRLFERTVEVVERETRGADIGMVMEVRLDIANNRVSAFADYPDQDW